MIINLNKKGTGETKYYYDLNWGNGPGMGWPGHLGVLLIGEELNRTPDNRIQVEPDNFDFEIDLSSMKDKELVNLLHQVKTEMGRRIEEKKPQDSKIKMIGWNKENAFILEKGKKFSTIFSFSSLFEKDKEVIPMGQL